MPVFAFLINQKIIDKAFKMAEFGDDQKGELAYDDQHSSISKKPRQLLRWTRKSCDAMESTWFTDLPT